MEETPTIESDEWVDSMVVATWKEEVGRRGNASLCPDDIAKALEKLDDGDGLVG